MDTKNLLEDEGDYGRDGKSGAIGGGEGGKTQLRWVRDKDKVKRKYSFKNGKPINPRKVKGWEIAK